MNTMCQADVPASCEASSLRSSNESRGEAGNRTYECAHCHGIFESGWSDEEAQAEGKGLWGDRPASEMCVICDGCFQSFYAWAEAEGLVNAAGSQRPDEEAPLGADECSQTAETGA